MQTRPVELHTMINSVRFLKLCCSVVAFVAALAITQSAHAQDAVVASSTIKGRVANAATGQFLQNAGVSIDGTSIKTTTAADGSYRFSNLPAGVYTVSVFYTGLDNDKHSVEVAANEEKAVDFELTSEVYVLGSFTVAAEREGSAKAIQEQRESNSIKNVVASDSFGNMVDGNMGELIKNLPGMSIDYGDGEDASTMRYRGMEPSQMSVTMNGNAMGNNAGSTTRTFSLNDLAVQNIEAIEVNFAPTPDQPSGTMGGAINFKTKSAFNQKGRRVRLDGNMSLNSTALEFQKTAGGARTPDRKLKPGFNLSYTEAFGKEHPFGIALNAGIAQRFRFNNAYRPGDYAYDTDQLAALNAPFVTEEVRPLLNSLLMQERAQANERRFISLNLDFKLSESTSVYLYNSYTYDRGLGSYVHTVNFETPSANQPSTSTYNNITVLSSGKATATNEVSNANTKSWSINPGVKHRFGDLELSYDAYMSRSETIPDQDRNYKVSYSIKGLSLQIDDASSAGTPTVTQTNVNTAGTNDYLKLNNYNALSLVQDYATGKDTQYGAKIDGKKPFMVFGMPLIVQMGGRATESERLSQRFYREKKLTGGADDFYTSAEPKLGSFADTYFGNSWQYDAPIASWVSPYKVYDYYTKDPSQFVSNYLNLHEQAPMIQGEYMREKMGDKYSRERVYAGYAMATFQPVGSLSIVGGVRYEFTELKAKGWYVDLTDRPFYGAYPAHKYSLDAANSPYYGWSDVDAVNLILTKVKRTKCYDKLFPNLQVKWEPIKDLNIRAAYTTNMGRPDLDSIMPGDRIYPAYNNIRRTNTKLMPQEGENFDLRIEYYLPRSGLVGVTFFRQKIKNYIFDDTQGIVMTDEIDGALVSEGWTITTKENMGEGSNDGFEFNYRQRLGFIAKWLDEFEVYTAFSASNPKAIYYKRTASFVPNDPNHVTVEELNAFLSSPREPVTVSMPNVVDRSANFRINYNGKKFTASVAWFWRDDFLRGIRTLSDNKTLERQMQHGDLRLDLNATYKLSTRWKVYLDMRNVTKQPDYYRQILGRTNGYYTSGMIMNLGLRADL